MIFQPQEQTGTKRRQAERAIRLAMEGRWQEAIGVNRAILQLFPDDVDSLNRLAKALTELGRYAEAREVHQRALAIDPVNSIARKNLSRLSNLSEPAAREREPQKARPDLFIEETGKSGIATLHNAARDVLATMHAGDRVQLQRRHNVLAVTNAKGDYLAELDAKLGLRLLRLMEGGNRYEAALTSVADSHVRIIIKEVYQHPSQAGKLSFPPTTSGETFRPYIKEGLIRRALNEEAYEPEEGAEDWEGESEHPNEKKLYQMRRASTLLEEGQDDEEEEIEAV